MLQGTLGILDAVDEERPRGGAHRFEWLDDGGERGREVLGFLDTVAADEGDVLADLDIQVR